MLFFCCWKPLHIKGQNICVFCLKHNYEANTYSSSIMAKKESTACTAKAPGTPRQPQSLPATIFLPFFTVSPAVHGSPYNTACSGLLQNLIELASCRMHCFGLASSLNMTMFVRFRHLLVCSLFISTAVQFFSPRIL